MGDADLRINLYRKVRYFSYDFGEAVTVKEIKDYRMRLLNKYDTLNETEKRELEILDEWILESKQPYKLQDKKNSMKTVKLCLGFTNEMFETMIPMFKDVIVRENEWVCLYHDMILYGWMDPVEFYTWVDWLNDRLTALGEDKVLKGSSRRQVNAALIKPDKCEWNYEDYSLGTNNSTQTKRKFQQLLTICKEINKILNFVYFS